MLFALPNPFYSDNAAKRKRVAFLKENFCHGEEICFLLLKIGVSGCVKSQGSQADVAEYLRMWHAFTHR
jgi:hypothetical protein